MLSLIHLYVLTVKSSGMLARQEFELPIDEAAYLTLCAKADGNVIAKTRYKMCIRDRYGRYE